MDEQANERMDEWTIERWHKLRITTPVKKLVYTKT